MPRVHKVKRAQKDYPRYNIKKGDTYFWWKFRRQSRTMSLTYPKPWQLTQSPFLQWLYQFEHELKLDTASLDTLKEGVQSMIDEIETARDEVEMSYENMPEQLRDTSDSGMILEERLNNLSEWIDKLQEIVYIDELENPTEEELENGVSIESRHQEQLEALAEEAMEHNL